jgi:hypothetical protein
MSARLAMAKRSRVFWHGENGSAIYPERADAKRRVNLVSKQKDR